MSLNGFPTGSPQPTLLQTQGTVEQAVGNLVQHSQHLRIKKLLYGVCYDTWENRSTYLDSVSIGSLIDTLLGQFTTLQQCRDSLHRKAYGLNRSKLYIAVADTIIYYLQQALATHGGYQASTDQQAANLSAAIQRRARSDFYQPVVDAVSKAQDPDTIKLFLGYLGQRPGHIADTVSSDLLSLVQQAHRQSPTPLELKQRLLEIVHNQPSPRQAQLVARQILRAFRPLYMTQSSPVVTTPDSLSLLEQELTRKCDPYQARVLLYSVLYGPYAASPLQRQILRSKTLRSLLREIFDYCGTYSDFESKLTILVHCIEPSDGLNRALKVMLVSLYGYYTRAQCGN